MNRYAPRAGWRNKCIWALGCWDRSQRIVLSPESFFFLLSGFHTEHSQCLIDLGFLHTDLGDYETAVFFSA